MSIYIDKNLLVEQISLLCLRAVPENDYGYGYDDCLLAVQDLIEDMPTIDLATKLEALEGEIKRLKLELQYAKADVGNKIEPAAMSDEWQQAIGLE